MGRVEGNPIHNECRTQAYRAWSNMKARCNNPRANSFKNYGARGITYSIHWESYLGFIRDMGHPPSPYHTLERKDNSLGYSKDNCCWATRKTQANNRRVFHNNTSGISGVNYEPALNRWKARVYHEGKRITLYTGPDFFEACCARLSWKGKNV